MANLVDPDDTAHYKLSYQDLHCWRMYLVRWVERVNALVDLGYSISYVDIRATFTWKRQI